jgi:hypothetical protein
MAVIPTQRAWQQDIDAMEVFTQGRTASPTFLSLIVFE